MQLVFNILSWGAWSPDFPNKDAWSLWQKSYSPGFDNSDSPSLVQVPAMQRRRFSRLTKMMLSAAFECEPQDQCRSVFASRHGELTRTLGLLQDITAQQALSPIAFSQSVHNTASGIFGIVTGNTSPSTSVAAGEETLPQAFIEAYAQLVIDPRPILLVFGDDPVPPVYSEYINQLELPISLGFYLAPFDAASCSQGAKLTLTAAPHRHEVNHISLMELIHHLATGQDVQGQLCHWHWSLQHA